MNNWFSGLQSEYKSKSKFWSKIEILVKNRTFAGKVTKLFIYHLKSWKKRALNFLIFNTKIFNTDFLYF